MSTQLTKVAGTITTVSPSQLSALSIDSMSVTANRPILWWDRDEGTFNQAVENDTAYLAFLESGLVAAKFDMTSPVIKYRVSRPADLTSFNAKAIAAADTYISLDDSLIVRTGQLLNFTDYDTQYRVLDVDDDLSSGWQNNAGDACNIKVERLVGPAVAIPANTVAQAGTAVMSELGTPGPATTSVPGDPVYNNITLMGMYCGISKLQMESTMNGAWGTHPKIRDDMYYQHRLRKQMSMLFDHRYTGVDSQLAGSQIYISAGVIPQIKSHIMEAGSLGVNLVGGKLNDFWESLFASELSSSDKVHFCGSAQFRDIRRAAVEYGMEVERLGIQSGAQNPMSLGANTMVVTLQSGRRVTVYELRKAFGAANMVDFGVTLDAGNIGVGAYKNLQEVWFENVESPLQAITKRTDAMIDTWTVCVKDESTCGVIRGGTRGLVTR